MAYVKQTATVAMEKSSDIRMFESKFRARVEDSKEYRHADKADYMYNEYDYNYRTNNYLKVVPMKAIHLPEECFNELVQQQYRLANLQSDAEYGKKLWNMLRADERVRDDNPAVAKAYRNYLTLLELART